EVSIDGARGILFNVIGGSDMSMHEINTVAETITSAADPEANIIFGASINPELEGELIVTVIATGFDDSYFASRERAGARLMRRADELDTKASSTVDEASMQNLDMDLKDDEQSHAEDFHSEETPNIWAMSDDGNTSDADSAEEEHGDKYETPSFFRRFRRGRKDDSKPGDTTSGDDS